MHQTTNLPFTPSAVFPLSIKPIDICSVVDSLPESPKEEEKVTEVSIPAVEEKVFPPVEKVTEVSIPAVKLPFDEPFLKDLVFLFFCRYGSNDEIKEALKENPDINFNFSSKDGSTSSPWSIAVERGDPLILKTLREQGGLKFDDFFFSS